MPGRWLSTVSRMPEFIDWLTEQERGARVAERELNLISVVASVVSFSSNNRK